MSNRLWLARYVWDPTVHHQLYDEQCCYFLLRLRNPDPVVVGRIRDLVVKEGVVSSCYYSVYGYYDILIRLWASSHKRTRFINALNLLKDNIDTVNEFQAREIDYCWSKNAPPPSDALLNYKDDVEKIARAASNGQPIDKALLDRLEKDGLVHRLPETSERGIKFYVALTKIPGHYSTPYEYSHLSKFIKKELELENKSIYTGLGFASYLIKAVAAEFGAIVHSSNKLLEFLRPLALRSMTLIISDSQVLESDMVDVEWDRMPKNLTQLDLILGSEAADAAARLPAKDQLELSSVFGQFREFLNSPLAQAFKDVLLARIQLNQIAFIEKLSFIMRLEGLLRRYLIEECTATLGQHWVQVCQRLASECGLESDKLPATYTMHDLVAMLNKLMRNGLIPQDKVLTALGPEWQAQLKEIPGLRNEFAHGRLYDNAKLFDKWAEIVQIAFNAGYVYNRLVERYEKPIV